LLEHTPTFQACPYYAARKAAKEAQLVALPYNVLLHAKTREACGLDLTKETAVVIDEAHNLADTVAGIHSARVTGAQLCHAYSQLSQYHDKYKTRFAPANKVRSASVLL
jgi:chromosome transmission fidelity protein 1